MDTHFVRIKELKQVLGNCGYHPYQIQGIMQEVYTGSLEHATETDLLSIISSLEEQINFALKCKKGSLR